MLESIKLKFYTVILYIGAIINKNHFSKVIYYHDIHSTDEEKCTEMSTPISLFISHLKVIENLGYEVVKEITNPMNQVQLTFDDGYRGLYNNRVLLKDANIFPTVFIITSKVGCDGYMNWQEINELKQLGFNIQSHTHSHCELNTLNLQSIEMELSISKELLELNVNDKIDAICFPRGMFNESVLETCQRVGYTKWYSSIPGDFREHSIHKEFKFRYFVQSAEPFELKCILMGGMKILRFHYSKKHYGKKIYIS